MNNVFDPLVWGLVPFHFWSVVFFVFGAIVGSFLNVCVYRMPRDLSVIRPHSRCPHCEGRIAWRHNIPMISWLVLRGKCADCRHPISFRYPVVELATALGFLVCWLSFGPQAGLALSYCILLSLLLAATLIDVEHFIIPDEITVGGIFLGVAGSALVPALHGAESGTASALVSLGGLLGGAGVVYLIVRVGKLLFGRLREELGENVTVVFGEEALHLPRGREIPYGDMLYRKTDTIIVPARKVEMIDRCYPNAEVRLSQERLLIGSESFDPESVSYLEAVTDRIVIPREAMGLGDVKFMGAIGAFLGWQATLFSLMLSSFIGALLGVGLILSGRQEWSSRLPYGPYIAAAAVAWIFMPAEFRAGWNRNLDELWRMIVPGGWG